MSKKLYLIWGKSMKKFISLVILFLVSVGIVFAQAEPEILKSRLGIVKHIKYVDTMENNIEQVKQIASVEILDGEFKGELIDIDNMVTGNPYYDIKLKKGSKKAQNHKILSQNYEKYCLCRQTMEFFRGNSPSRIVSQQQQKGIKYAGRKKHFCRRRGIHSGS